jgi:hypothetical protein
MGGWSLLSLVLLAGIRVLVAKRAKKRDQA